MRIPYAPDNQDVPNKPPIYLIPDVFLTAEMFTHLGPENSPAFTLNPNYNLASQGFDVWISNQRGTIHSQDHVELDPDDPDSGYWDYDLVSYRQDYMADITTIKDSTGYGTVGVLGFHNGAAALAYAMALEPEYFNENANVQRSGNYFFVGVLMAFVPSYAHSNAPVFGIASYTTGMNNMLASMGVNVMSPAALTFIHSFIDGMWNGEINPFTDTISGIQNRYLLNRDMSILKIVMIR